MRTKTELEQVVGKENVSDNPQALKDYSGDYSLTQPSLPNYVVWPKNPEEIQGIMRLADRKKIPVIPSSSRVHFHGATIPSQGGIILDLSRMNKILNINEVDGSVQIEPGVTWEQLQTKLGEMGFRCMIPLCPHPARSVLTSFLEMEYPVVSFFEYGMPLQSMGVVWANGERYTTGSASVRCFGQPGCFASGVNPQGPGAIDFYRLFQGAQGTMGVVTWAIVKIEPIPTLNKTFFIPAIEVTEIVEPLYAIGRRKIGYECLALNNVNLAAILSESWPADSERLRESLPAWTIILVLGGLRRRPKEKIEYEEEALREIRSSMFPSLDLLTTLPGLARVEGKMPKMLSSAWPSEMTYWKQAYKGGFQDLFFITTMDRVPELVEAVYEQVSDYQYPLGDLGCYVQPIENARACHCEFNFYYNPHDPASIEKIQELYSEAARTLLNMGVFFSRPYGIVADMVYSRSSGYTEALKKFKGIVDPNGIMCPGNLCF